MHIRKFIKNKEDFICQKCGAEVKGDGYTNHCHVCLWSKHVDIFPGDRLADCGGLMKPVEIQGSTGEGYKIKHICEKCAYEKVNKLASNDNMEMVFKIIHQNSAKFERT